MDHITSEGLSMWKTDYYLKITANLLVQPKYKAQIITSSERICKNTQFIILRCPKWLFRTKGTLSLICPRNRKPPFPWLHHRKCKNRLHLLLQNLREPKQWIISIVWPSDSVWILLNGILGWKWTLTAGWVGWNINNHFCFFLSPNSMTHGNSHFLLPPSTWLHYQQTAGDWICFWGWVTTISLSHSARWRGSRRPA